MKLALTVIGSTFTGWRGRAPVLAAIGGLLMGIALADSAWSERAEGLLFDTQVRLLRAYRKDLSLPPGSDVVIVGIDAASLDGAGVPLALIHRPLGRALEAIAQAGASAIAIDLVLPERPVDRWLPGADEALTRALGDAGRRCAVVFVLEPDARGSLRAPYTPFAAALGERGLVTALLPVDGDGVVRRFDPSLSAPGLQTLAGQIASSVGAAQRAARPGWIDYTRGAAFDYVPLIALAQPLPGLRSLVEGRVVLIGSVLPYVDRVSQPVSLVGWEYPQTAPPAVVIHAQLLRSLLGHGLVQPIRAAWNGLAAMLLVLIASAPGIWARWIAVALAAAAIFVLATILHGEGWRLATFVPVSAAFGAGGLRTLVDLSSSQRERARLSRAFAGYVSPQVLRAILDGRLDISQGRRRMAFVFADLRGFTAWSEATPAEQVFEALNRYFAVVTPLIHRCGGTIDNFRGDGIMIIFGAPEHHDSPCRSAFDAARQIVRQARAFFCSDPAIAGRALDIAVGISFGEAVYGDLGGADRKDFTAIGDAVNVAARLQDLAKSLDYPVVMTMDAFERLGSIDDPGNAPRALGEFALRGHSPVAIAGWRPSA